MTQANARPRAPAQVIEGNTLDGGPPLKIVARQPGAAGMRRSARIHIVVAAVLATLVVGSGALPADARRVERSERLAYRLLNCLRTGGIITRAGTCRGYGSGKYSRYRRPLTRSGSLSREVAFPYAARIARTGQCRHDIGGSSYDQRFRTAGFRNPVNGENLACLWGSTPRHMVIRWMRYWYREGGGSGPHWRQIKDRDFRSAGIGVARHRSGRSALVIDFYGHRVR